MRGSDHRGGGVVDEADLLRRARTARERAYAPYSGLRVGAAALTEDGQVFEGANVENAAYALSACAERVAIQALVCSGTRSPLVAVAVVGDGADAYPPCGACRQVIFEFGPDAVVYASGDGGRPLVAAVRDLLPHTYGPRRFAQGRDADQAVGLPRW